MDRAPRPKNDRLMHKQDVWQMTYVSVIIAGMGLLVFELMRGMNVPFEVASTMAVNIIIFGKIFYLFNIRTSRLAFDKTVLFSNPMAYVSIGLMIIFQLIFTYVPFMNGIFSTTGLYLPQWGIVLIASLPVLIVAELNKMYLQRKQQTATN